MGAGAESHREGHDDEQAHAHGGHSHGGIGHSHGVGTETDTGMLVVALAINGGFMAIEVVLGIVAHSLALLSDAAHMLSDAGAIGMALVAAHLARRAPSGAMTFGLKRAEILSAQVNGITLLVLATFILYEAVRRLIEPPEIEASLLLWVGLGGILVNLAAAVALARANRESLNVEGAFQHNLIDAYSSAAAAAAGGIILITGFERADAIASLAIVLTMVRSGWGLIKASGRIFLEAAPEGLDPDEIGRELLSEPGVVQVHDLHVWEVTSGFPALSAHVIVRAESDCHRARFRLANLLEERFGIGHSTLQVEHEPDSLLEIETTAS